MALFKKLFNSKKNASSVKDNIGTSQSGAVVVAEEPITLQELKKLIPIRQLDTEFLEAFALESKAKVFAAGTTLFAVGNPADSIYFLLRGEIDFVDEQGRKYVINTDDAKSRFALSAGRIHTTTAVANTEVSVLEVSQDIMKMNQAKKLEQLHIPAKYENNSLLQLFVQHFAADEIDIPSLPDTALKLRRAMESDIGIQEAADIIQLDPVVSGKLIQVANCPLYVSVHPAKSCLEAVKRIGLLGVRSLVTSICLKHIFQSEKLLLNNYMTQLWKRSVYISCLCYVLAKETKKVDPEEALLAGLVVDIGIVPFLSFVDNLPEDFYTEVELKEAMHFIRGAAGRSVLQKWDFPEEIIDIPYYANDWYQHQSDEITLLDIVVLAELHSKIGQKDRKEYPVISSIPAASKLHDATLSPVYSLTILHDAKDKVNAALRAFV
jgi:HD-like signal output (HDOD) protein